MEHFRQMLGNRMAWSLLGDDSANNDDVILFREDSDGADLVSL